MNIKVYIVTYKNDAVLKNCLESLRDSDVQVSVVNNYWPDNLSWVEDYNCRLITNMTRPPFSTGHLARNWNECLVDGFQDLDNPQADIIVCCQNDVVFKPGWIDLLKKNIDKYSFITYGAGDAACAYRPEALQSAGLWDERYANIGHQENDYFLKQFLYNRSGSSINDHCHRHLSNPISVVDSIIYDMPSGWNRKEPTHLASMEYHKLACDLFHKKWSLTFDKICDATVPEGLRPIHPQFVMYPYFEKGITNRELKGYFHYN
jgi:hypothetical protein